MFPIDILFTIFSFTNEEDIFDIPLSVACSFLEKYGRKEIIDINSAFDIADTAFSHLEKIMALRFVSFKILELGMERNLNTVRINLSRDRYEISNLRKYANFWKTHKVIKTVDRSILLPTWCTSEIVKSPELTKKMICDPILQKTGPGYEVPNSWLLALESLCYDKLRFALDHIIRVGEGITRLSAVKKELLFTKRKYPVSNITDTDKKERFKLSKHVGTTCKLVPWIDWGICRDVYPEKVRMVNKPTTPFEKYLKNDAPHYIIPIIPNVYYMEQMSEYIAFKQENPKEPRV